MTAIDDRAGAKGAMKVANDRHIRPNRSQRRAKGEPKVANDHYRRPTKRKKSPEGSQSPHTIHNPYNFL
ncbi:hypothetical protein CVD27_12085 [Neobacillus cucumis]|uniref:Uncharacterized protein n=1 Tax=Neobacillus cucumis TaxID=1740721 RepID=A0A2N5HFG0_9BACI|nr:hypothetical protein CVD27_12085 [Neobacillus cucumis]